MSLEFCWLQLETLLGPESGTRVLIGTWEQCSNDFNEVSIIEKRCRVIEVGFLFIRTWSGRWSVLLKSWQKYLRKIWDLFNNVSNSWGVYDKSRVTWSVWVFGPKPNSSWPRTEIAEPKSSGSNSLEILKKII